MPRADISGQLVHFTSGADDEEAYGRLCAILDQRRLIGGNGMIRGGFVCVCFTEAPLASLPDGLVNPAVYSRYKPFGVMFDKAWVFAQGGRPVIYQSDAEFDALPEAVRWRHVRYEPIAVPPIDFTWEREWRLRVDELAFEPVHSTLVLPDQAWLDRLRDGFDEQQAWRVEQYAQIVGPDVAAALREEFTWQATHVHRDEVRYRGIPAA
jgi:hypothetical protein